MVSVAAISALLIVASNINDVKKQISKSKKAVSLYLDGNPNSSSGVRLLQWEKAICMTGVHPVFGSGPRTYKEHMLDNSSPCGFTTRYGYFNQAHSVYFQTLATKGVVGFIALMAFFISIIVISIKNRSTTALMTSAAVIAMLSYGATVDLLFKVSVADRHIVLLGILAGIGLAKR